MARTRQIRLIYGDKFIKDKGFWFGFISDEYNICEEEILMITYNGLVLNLKSDYYVLEDVIYIHENTLCLNDSDTEESIKDLNLILYILP